MTSATRLVTKSLGRTSDEGGVSAERLSEPVPAARRASHRRILTTKGPPSEESGPLVRGDGQVSSSCPVTVFEAAVSPRPTPRNEKTLSATVSQVG